MKKMPQISVKHIVDNLNMSAPTARSALTHMVTLGILEMRDARQRDKIYVYKKYLSMLEEGAQPIR